MPGYVETGFYGGVSADLPYFRKKTMGCLVQGDRLDHAGSLELHGMRDGDTNDPDVCLCLSIGPAVYGSDFLFSWVFWHVSWMSPEKPLSPTYNSFKVFLRNADI